MTITEKLAKLTEGKNKADLARRVGLKATTISDYIAKAYAPRSDIALKMARALEVPVDWLIDDAQGWPAPPQSSVAALSTEDLVNELGRRMRPIGVAMVINIRRAQRENWVKLAHTLLATDVDAQLPANIRNAIEIPGELKILENQLRHYDPLFTAGEDAPAELLKEVLPSFQARMSDLGTWHRNLRDKHGYRQTAALAGLWGLTPEYRPPWIVETIAHTKRVVTGELAALLPEKPAAPPSLSRKRRKT